MKSFFQEGGHIQTCEAVASAWERWCGVTPWSISLRLFGNLGGKVIWYGGMPRCASAIPLCFTLIMPDGTKYNGRSRLMDIKDAITQLH
jgi:hypothetical protein